MRGAILNLVNFTETDLTGADLTGAILQESWLDRAILSGANLYSVNLFWASLQNTDLQKTTLCHMNATYANFSGSHFRAFSHANLSKTDFSGAFIHETNIIRHNNFIWETIMPDGTIEKGPYIGG